MPRAGRASFELEGVRCDRTPSGASMVRITGRWPAETDVAEKPLELLVDPVRDHPRLVLTPVIARAIEDDRWEGSYVVPSRVRGSRPCRLRSGGLTLPLPEIDFDVDSVPMRPRRRLPADDGQASRKGRKGRLPSAETSADVLVAAGAAAIALTALLVVFNLSGSHPIVLPLAAGGAVVGVLLLRHPEWIVPAFLGFAWASIDSSLVGGFSPLQPGSLALLFAAAWFMVRRVDIAANVFVVALLVSVPAVAASLTSSLGAEPPTDLAKQLPFLAIAAMTLRDRVDVDRTTIAMTCAGLFLGAGAIWSVTVGGSTLFPLEVDPTGGEAVRAAGPFGESNFFALSLAALVPFAIYQWSRPGWRRVLGLATVPVLLGGIVATGSRGGLLAAGVALLAMALASGVRGARIGAALTVIAALAIVPLLGGQTKSLSERTVSGRATENLIALKMFGDHPFLGVGPGNYPTLYRDYARNTGEDTRVKREPHSFPLQIAAEQGLVGLLAWIAALLVVWRAARQGGVMTSPLGRATVFAVLTFLVGSLFLHGSLQRLLFILFGMILALAGDPPPRRAPTDPAPAA